VKKDGVVGGEVGSLRIPGPPCHATWGEAVSKSDHRPDRLEQVNDALRALSSRKKTLDITATVQALTCKFKIKLKNVKITSIYLNSFKFI
jgi:hypothetical protein